MSRMAQRRAIRQLLRLPSLAFRSLFKPRPFLLASSSSRTYPFGLVLGRALPSHGDLHLVFRPCFGESLAFLFFFLLLSFLLLLLASFLPLSEDVFDGIPSLSFRALDRLHGAVATPLFFADGARALLPSTTPRLGSEVAMRWESRVAVCRRLGRNASVGVERFAKKEKKRKEKGEQGRVIDSNLHVAWNQ